MAKILLIDDDADFSGFLQPALEEHGYLVEYLDRPESGPEALSRGNFDLVLLDYKMPGMTGIECLDALQKSGIYVP